MVAVGVVNDNPQRAKVRLASEQEAQEAFGGQGSLLGELVEAFVPLREAPLQIAAEALKQNGQRPSAELNLWMQYFERYELEVIDPCGVELRAPGEIQSLEALLQSQSPAWIADLLGFFTASTVIAQQDEMSYLASWAGTPAGTSRIYYFHPSDWGLWPTDPSISARLYRFFRQDSLDELSLYPLDPEQAAQWDQGLKVYEAQVESHHLPEHLNPKLLLGRVNWLVHALLGIGREWSRDLLVSATYSDFQKEKEYLAQWPHLSSYWLWSHYLLGNREALFKTLEITEKSQHPVVQDSRKAVRMLSVGRKTKFAGQDTSVWQALAGQIQAKAPLAVFEPRQKEVEINRRQRISDEAESEAIAWAKLQQSAGEEPLVEESLLLLAHLGTGSAAPPAKIDLHGGLEADQAIDRLAEIVDERFRPVVVGRLRRAARHGDTHRDAGWGLILAWAALAEDLDEFEAILERCGTGNFGPRRLRELYRAYGYFDDPRATEILAQAAKKWMLELDDWIRMAPEEPLRQLLKRDSLYTHQLCAEILRRARFSAANWDICVEVAKTAGRLNIRRALPGLRRAVSERLGRVDDGGRAQVVAALIEVDPENSYSVLYQEFEETLAAWEASEDEDDIFNHQKDLAAVCRGLLALRPQETKVLEVSAALLQVFRLRMGPKRRPRKEVLASVIALFQGIKAGEIRALRRCLPAFIQPRYQTTPSTRGLCEEIRNLALELQEELA